MSRTPMSPHDLAATTPEPTRTRRRAARRGGAVLAAVAVGLATAPAASAHVRVFPDSTAGGGYTKLTFRVPNESDTAGTTSLVVTLPESAPLASVSTQPVAGWTATVTKAKLATPITVHGTQLDEAPRTVTWTAAEGVQIAPGQFQEFAISAGPLPESGELVFSAAQTYSDGKVVTWDQPETAGGEEPEHPAPAFAITPAEPEGDEAAAANVSAAAPAASSVAADDDRSTAALWLAAVSLVVGAAGVLVGAVGVRRGRQR
jgi:periplasmic copper chaperone A